MLADPKVKALAEVGAAAPARLLHRLPGAADLRGDEAGREGTRASITSSADIGCHLFSILPPFNIGATTMGYGLGPASASAFNVKADKRSISVMGDGGFWHNGLSTSRRQCRLQQA